ncbi:potassium channel family protein [Halobacteriaceae archaeon GCM10025711]
MAPTFVDAFVERPLLRRALVPVGAFTAIAAGGVAGFVVLGNVGVIEAAFWLLDPASISVHGAGPRVKAFALVVISGLVVTGLWIGETVLSAAFGGQIQEELRTVQTQRAIDDLDDHVIICGHGMFGRTIASHLADQGRDVVVIETDEAEHRRVTEAGHLALNADARREETLRDAGVERADTLVAAIDESNANIQIAITASQIAPPLTVVVRVGDELYESLARRAGADHVVIPEVMSGEQVTTAMTRAGEQ